MDGSVRAKGVILPRIAITFCRQCKWNLRAAYYAQELLSTFESSIGEVALIPTTGGVFQVHLTYTPTSQKSSSDAGITVDIEHTLLWDRKTDGGFPETKILKQRVRNHIAPDKNLGHSDTPAKVTSPAVEDNAIASQVPVTNASSDKADENKSTATASACEDCA